MENNADSKLKDRFSNYGDKPSPKVWKNIEREIQQDSRRKRFLWLFFVTSSICLATFLLFKLEINPYLTPTKKVDVGTNVRRTKLKVHNATAVIKSSIQIEEENENIPETTSNYKQTILPPPVIGCAISSIGSSKINPNNSSEKVAKRIPLFSKTDDTDTMVNLDKLQIDYLTHTKQALPTNEQLQAKLKYRGFQFSFVVGFNDRLQNDQTQISTTFNSGSALIPIEETMAIKYTYKQTIAGILANYRYTKYLACETGIYLINNTSQKIVNEHHSMSTKDLLIGLPIRMKLQLITTPKWKIHLSAGLQLQVEIFQKNNYFDNPVNSSFADYTVNSSSVQQNQELSGMSQIGLDFYYYLNPKYAIRLSPFYQYYTLNSDRFTQVTGNAKHWFGLQSGILLNCRKTKYKVGI